MVWWMNLLHSCIIYDDTVITHKTAGLIPVWELNEIHLISEGMVSYCHEKDKLFCKRAK